MKQRDHCCSEIQDKRKKIQDLSAARDVDSEAAVRRLKESETRLRADVGAASATNDSLRARLIENNDPEYRRLLVLQVKRYRDPLPTFSLQHKTYDTVYVVGAG